MRYLLIVLAFLTNAGYAQTCSEGKIHLVLDICVCTGDSVTGAVCEYEPSQYGCDEEGHTVTCKDGCDFKDAGECDLDVVGPSAMQKVKMGDPDIIRFAVARRISTACGATEEVFERWFQERFPHAEALPKTDTGGI